MVLLGDPLSTKRKLLHKKRIEMKLSYKSDLGRHVRGETNKKCRVHPDHEEDGMENNRKG